MPEPIVTPEFTIIPDDASAILFNAREYREYDVEVPQEICGGNLVAGDYLEEVLSQYDESLQDYLDRR